jgi:hypothetical protein
MGLRFSIYRYSPLRLRFLRAYNVALCAEGMVYSFRAVPMKYRLQALPSQTGRPSQNSRGPTVLCTVYTVFTFMQRMNKRDNGAGFAIMAFMHKT